MANIGKGQTINKVVIGTETHLDLTADTVTSSTLQKGVTAHDNSGTKITGSLVVPKIQTSKSVTITANGTTTISPDSGYSGIGKTNVTVNVPSSVAVSLPTVPVRICYETDGFTAEEGDICVYYSDPNNTDNIGELVMPGGTSASEEIEIPSCSFVVILSSCDFESYESIMFPSGTNGIVSMYSEDVAVRCYFVDMLNDIDGVKTIKIKLRENNDMNFHGDAVWINPD